MTCTASMEAFPRLHGERVVLQAFDAQHITTEYLGWLSDPLLMRYSNQRFRTHDRRSSLTYLDSFRGTPNLFLALHAGGVFVGTMTAYFTPHHGTADMGLLVGAEFQGKGLGGDAWRTLLKYLLGSGIRKVTGGTLRCNHGMVRIMESSGMEADGVRVGQELVDGLPQDVLYFARFGR